MTGCAVRAHGGHGPHGRRVVGTGYAPAHIPLGSVFSAVAFAEPALFALTIAPAESTARAAGRRVGMAEVEMLTAQLTHLFQLDCRYGSGQLREQVVQLLHRQATTVLHGSYSDKTGQALLTAVAQASWLAGCMAEDVGRHSLAQRYYIQALQPRHERG